MRLHFRTLTRPKHLAKRLTVVFPALTLMQAQEWAARLLGYRNWHELSNSVGPDVTETPDHVISFDDLMSGGNAEANSEFFKRSLEQRKTLEGLIGNAMPNMASLFFHVDPNYPDVRFKKLGKTAQGAPAFKGFEYDLFAHEGEAPGVGGGRCHDVGVMGDRLYTYSGLPAGRDEDAFIAELLQRMRKGSLPFRGYDSELQRAVRGSSFGVTHFSIESADDEPESTALLATQVRCHRIFLLENEMPVGAVGFHLVASTSSDVNSVQLTVTIDEAWSAFDTRDVVDAFVMTMADTICEPIQRLIWFRVNNTDMRIAVDFFSESESPLTWTLVSELNEVIPDTLLDDAAEKSVLAGIEFNASICP